MRRLALAMMTACLLLALAMPAAARPAALSIKSKAQVAGGWVSLLDLVEGGRDLPRQVRRSLAAQMVTRAPDRSRKVVVPGARLRELLGRAGLPRDWSVLIPSRVELTRRMRLVGAEELADIYRRALAQRLGPRAARADIHSIEVSRQVMVPAGHLEHQVHLVGERLLGRVPATVTLAVDGKRVAQVRVVGRVDLYAQVVVTRASLPRGHLLQDGDLELARVNLGAFRGHTMSDPQMLVGMRLRRNLPAGSPVLLNQVERAPLIRRGQVVTMICVAPGMRVTAKGKAEQTGYKHSRIRLTNLASKREVYGEVLDAGTVLVRF